MTSLVTSSRLSGLASMSSQVDFCLKNSKAVLSGCINNHKVLKVPSECITMNIVS